MIVVQGCEVSGSGLFALIIVVQDNFVGSRVYLKNSFNILLKYNIFQHKTLNSYYLVVQ